MARAGMELGRLHQMVTLGGSTARRSALAAVVLVSLIAACVTAAFLTLQWVTRREPFPAMPF